MAKNIWSYSQAGEICVRDVVINTSKGGKNVIIAHITDLHYKGCTEEDLKDPVLASTYQGRLAFDTKITVPNARRVLDYIDGLNPAQIVITGDAIDYLSEGTLLLLKQEIWDRYRDADGKVRKVLVTMGNHEPLRQMQGTVEDTTALESRIKMLEDRWEHDIYYTSRIFADKVMLVQMDNSLYCDSGNRGFWDRQIQPFADDIRLAREKGYILLLFYHIPLVTGKQEDASVEATVIGDKHGKYADFFNVGVGPDCSAASSEIYRLITENADIIGGCFCGHNHCDYYTEIQCPNGDVIPQYALTGTSYHKGHLLKITVR